MRLFGTSVFLPSVPDYSGRDANSDGISRDAALYNRLCANHTAVLQTAPLEYFCTGCNPDIAADLNGGDGVRLLSHKYILFYSMIRINDVTLRRYHGIGTDGYPPDLEA